jgi:hypothetical protein
MKLDTGHRCTVLTTKQREFLLEVDKLTNDLDNVDRLWRGLSNNERAEIRGCGSYYRGNNCSLVLASGTCLTILGVRALQ